MQGGERYLGSSIKQALRNASEARVANFTDNRKAVLTGFTGSQSRWAFHSAEQPSARDEWAAAVGEMFNAEHYRKTNSDRIVVSDNLLTWRGALMRSQRSDEWAARRPSQPYIDRCAGLRVTPVAPAGRPCRLLLLARSSSSPPPLAIASVLYCTK